MNQEIPEQLFKRLREVLAYLYHEEQGIRKVIWDAGINALRISFNTSAEITWHNVLTEAGKTGQVDNLLIVVKDEYKTNQRFLTIYTEYTQHRHSARYIANNPNGYRDQVKPVDTSELIVSDRQQECDKFRRILCGDSPYRVLIVHSNGKSRAGKTTLLGMFERICEEIELPWLITPKIFDADHYLNWKVILDATAETLGETNFTNYLRVRSKALNSRESRITEQTGSRSTVTIGVDSGQFDSSTHMRSDDIGFGKPETVALNNSSFQASFSNMKTANSVKEIQEQLTRTFLHELDNHPDQHRVVWLIDKAEDLHDETKAWLKDLFGKIGELKVQRLILVVAGQQKLFPVHPRWSRYIDEISIAFTVEVVRAIISKAFLHWEEDRREFLTKFIYKEAEGDPFSAMGKIMKAIEVDKENRRITYG